MTVATSRSMCSEGNTQILKQTAGCVAIVLPYQLACELVCSRLRKLRGFVMFQFGGPNCKVCRLIRVYLLVAIPILMMMWIRPDFQIPSGVDGRALVGYAFGLGAIGMLVFRYYTDIYKKKK